jgi:L-phenylalanine/L-methionine N-acetyltransferase
MTETARGSDAPEEASSGPPAGLEIRGWQAADAEGMAALANLPNYRFGTLRQPYETPDFWRRRIESTGADTLSLVAVLDGSIVGSIGLQRMAGRRAHTGVLGMGVHDAFQGRGIGTALMEAVVEAADRWLGLTRLQLTVYADNPAAIALYRKFGFEVEGTFRAFALRDGAYVDALAMARLV